MARPEGTDGSDHVYREQIEDRYYWMALYKRISSKCIPVQTALVVLRTLWNLVPMLEGIIIPPHAYVIFFGQLLLLLSYGMAKMNSPKPSDTFRKVYSALTALMAMEQCLVLYSYHRIWGESMQYPRIVSRWLVSSYYIQDYELSHSVLTKLETVVDGALLLSWLIPGFLMFQYQKLQKDSKALAKMRIESKNKAK